MDFLHLALIFFICTAELEATDYYVQPTEPAGTSCPGQPCHTLSQYSDLMNQEHSFGSHAVFKFLPWTHNVSTPFTFTNVSNVSLIGTQSHSDSNLPVLITQSFSCPYCVEQDSSCEFCAVIDFQNVTGAIIEGIKIIIINQSFFQVYELHGITSQFSNSLAIDNVHVINHSIGNQTVGISILYSNNVSINYTDIQSVGSGVLLYFTDYVTFNNSISLNMLPEEDHGFGILLLYASDTVIVNSVMWDYYKALSLWHTRHTTIIAVTVTSACTSNSSINIKYFGILMWSAINTTILNTLVEKELCAVSNSVDSVVNSSEYYGIYLTNSSVVKIHGADIHMSLSRGVSVQECREVVLNDIHIRNRYLMFGIILLRSNNVTIHNTSDQY